jgi:acyl-CoA thioesterase
MSLPAILAASAREPGRLVADIPAGWMQGRTTYGGLSTALAFEAAAGAATALPPLRAAQVAFIGPVHGTVEASARVERQGRNATWIRSELRCEGQLALAATFVFMGPVVSAITLDKLPLPPGLILPEDAPLVTGAGPAFLDNLETRRAVPKGDEGLGTALCWVRLNEREGLPAFTHILAVGDGLPPGARTMMAERAPVSSMMWQIGLLTDQPETRDGWWLMRSAADFARNGSSTQAMLIWNRDGVPVVSGGQSIALFG